MSIWFVTLIPILLFILGCQNAETHLNRGNAYYGKEQPIQACSDWNYACQFGKIEVWYDRRQLFFPTNH